MKIIYSKAERVGNRAAAVTASSENPNYPASNLLLGQVSKVWRSVAAAPAIANATLTIAVPAGINNALGIFGCNSASIAYAVKNVTETTTYFSGTIDTTPSSPVRVFDRAWVEWTSNGCALHIILTFTALPNETYHKVGEIVVGETITLPDPKHGLGQDRENCQVVQKMAGGGYYIHDGALPRSYDLGWLMFRETEYDDLDEFYSVMGQKPMAMLLCESAANDVKWCGFFHTVSGPKASHDFIQKSSINMSIREAI